MGSMPVSVPAAPSTEEASVTRAIVASDGKSQSDGALLAARALQASTDDVRIVAAVPPLPIVSPEAQLPLDPEVESRRAADLGAAVEAQAQRVLGTRSRWTVDVRAGEPAPTIVDAAREAHANLVVTGLGRHGLVDRVFGDETALRLIRLGSLPVLAVPTSFAYAPRRIVVAMDFSQPSMRAARLAIDMAAESSTIHLVHVAPRDASSLLWSGGDWLATYEADAQAELTRAAARLNPPAGISIERTVLHGDPAAQLLAYAAKIDADLVAAGSHGHGFVARVLIGSVVTKVLRGSTCGVLITPSRAEKTERAVKARTSGAHVMSVPQVEWVLRLNEFTKRNIGRRGVLEIDDPELGAQAQEHDYPLLGATYDVHDGRVELMLGDLGSVERHLTRSIGDVRAIDILTTADGRDIALRIAHGAGQSLLTFTK